MLLKNTKNVADIGWLDLGIPPMPAVVTATVEVRQPLVDEDFVSAPAAVTYFKSQLFQYCGDFLAPQVPFSLS